MSESNSIPLPTNHQFKDRTGQVFGRLTVISYAGRSGSQSKWFVRCECGKETHVTGSNLGSGKTQSCGCIRAQRIAALRATHRKSKTPEFQIWHAMWNRCTNPNDKKFHIYRDRTPPPEWRSFERFLADVGPRPGKGYSLDRIDNDKPYGPGNCRWTTSHTQTRNSSRNVWVETPGGEILCLADACQLVGLDAKVISSFRSRGFSTEYASNGLLRDAA